MKTVFSAIALTIALPTLTFAQAKAPPESHGQHQGHMEHKDSQDCCEDKADCCEKMAAEGKKMDCCEKHGKEAGAKSASDPHAGHQGH